MTANEDLLDKSISHQIGLQRLSSAVRNKLVAHLNRVEDDLVTQIRNRLEKGTFTAKRQELVLRDIRELLNEAQPEALGIVREEMSELASYEVDFQTRMLRSASPVQLDVTKPSREQLRSIVVSRPFQGRLLREWVADLTAAQRRLLRDAIRMGMTEGETIDQIVRRVRGTRAAGFRDGILETTRRQAEALVRTAVNHTATRARETLYEENEDIIKGVQIVATLDTRTSEICMDQDGKVYPLGSGPRPPFHIGCRTNTVQVLKSWRELGIDIDEAPEGTRASMDGQVPAKTTYGEWLKRQPADVQDEALGRTKGKLFREGGLTVDRFVDNRGRAYTLDELRRRESEAFARAGVNG